MSAFAIWMTCCMVIMVVIDLVALNGWNKKYNKKGESKE